MYILNIGVSTNDILKPEYSLLNFSYVFLPISILIKKGRNSFQKSRLSYKKINSHNQNPMLKPAIR